MMRYLLCCLVVGLFVGGLTQPAALADFPKPNAYPLSWELKFDHAMPKRIAVLVPGTTTAQAYWYMTFTVTNNTDKERSFLPVFEMLNNAGQIVRSDNNIPLAVFDAIKAREKKQFLEQMAQLTGTIRLGEEQARDGVAIWPESDTRMGHFSIFVQGLTGEYTTIKNEDGKDTILRKTLQLNFFVRGDEVYPGEDAVNDNPEAWIMR